MQITHADTTPSQHLDIFKYVVNNSTDFIGTYDLDFVPTFINTDGLNLVGLDPSSLFKGLSITDFFYSEDSQHILNNFIPALIKNGKNECEVRFKNFKTGEPIWMIYSVFSIRDEGGNTVGYATVSKNITKQKLVEAELKESKLQLQFAVDAAQLGTWYYNPATNKFTANDRLKNWFGLAYADEIDLTYAINIIQEKDRDRVTAAIQNALDHASGGTCDVEYTIVHPHSKIKTIVHAKGKASFNNENIAYRINGTLEDITDQSIAAKQLKESVKRYEQLVHSSPFAIAILYGEDLMISVANQAIIDLWGKGWEIMYQSYFVALPELVEQGYKEVFGQVYKTGTPFNAVETPVEMVQDGILRLKYYDFLLYPQRDMGGHIEGIGIIATDVTPQALFNKKIKESEQRFSAAVQAVKGIVWTNNDKGEMVGEQPSWAKLTGQSFEEYQGYGWANAVHPDDAQGTIKGWEEAVKEMRVFRFEHRIKMKDGSWRAFSIKAIPLKNEDGSLREWVGVHTDIQEQKDFSKELERLVQERTKQLAQTNIELEKMNKELQSFAYISSHDLQEPLRKIQTFATIIKSREIENLSAAGKDYFNRMQYAALRMQTLIDDLLAYSRTSIAESKYEPTDLNKIVEEVKNDLKEEIEQKHALIQVGELSVVNVIPFQFRQLLQNLLSNSLKFSSLEHSPCIKICSEIAEGKAFNNPNLSQHNKYCHISISDNGIGFEQEFCERIFELFQRLHGRQEYTGTGIGLAIVKKIVENHNGIITATSELNKGAAFDIFLPMQ